MVITMAVSDERVVLTVAEVGLLLGISRTLAYEAVRRGELPSIRVGRRILVPQARLKDWLNSLEAASEKGH